MVLLVKRSSVPESNLDDPESYSVEEKRKQDLLRRQLHEMGGNPAESGRLAPGAQASTVL
jgi:hypothetical protein